MRSTGGIASRVACARPLPRSLVLLWGTRTSGSTCAATGKLDLGSLSVISSPRLSAVGRVDSSVSSVVVTMPDVIGQNAGCHLRTQDVLS